MQMWEGSRSGNLPSRSSMAPASMMSSSPSSSGPPSSSWAGTSVRLARTPPSYQLLLLGVGEQGTTSLSSLTLGTPCVGGQVSRYQRTRAEVPGLACAAQRGLGAVPVLAHLALEPSCTTTTSIMASRLCKSGLGARTQGGGCAGELGPPCASSGGSRHVDVMWGHGQA